MNQEAIDWTQFNHTELVTMSRWVNLKKITRAIPRELIIMALQELKDVEFINPIDGFRTTLKNYLTYNGRWDRFKMQAPAPECPNCERCSEMRALDCYLTNRTRLKAT